MALHTPFSCNKQNFSLASSLVIHVILTLIAFVVINWTELSTPTSISRPFTMSCVMYHVMSIALSAAMWCLIRLSIKAQISPCPCPSLPHLPSPLCLLFPLQVCEFSQLSCMLPWVYMMIGFTLCNKVHVSMPIHVTEWQYTRPHLMMSFGLWGLLPSFIWGLVDGYTSLWCAVCRAVMLGCIDLLPHQYWGLGVYLLLWIWRWTFAPDGYVHCGFALTSIIGWVSLMLIGFILSCSTRSPTYPPVQEITMAVTFMVCSDFSVKYCTQCITCTAMLPSGA